MIPFNLWSKQRIAEGCKVCTSRHKRYVDDPRVDYITELMPWGVIKKYLWRLEGACGPTELQNVIEGIYKRVVPDTELFFVHFGNYEVGGGEGG